MAIMEMMAIRFVPLVLGNPMAQLSLLAMLLDVASTWWITLAFTQRMVST